jgi:hypothetical protein
MQQLPRRFELKCLYDQSGPELTDAHAFANIAPKNLMMDEECDLESSELGDVTPVLLLHKMACSLFHRLLVLYSAALYTLTM